MKNIICSLVCLIVFAMGESHGAERPNVLFIIADDASCHLGQSYHCDWVQTPHIDALGKAGLIFDGMYTPTSKCAPSRAALITGRNPWQLEEAGNHQPIFPTKYKAFTEVLAESGIHCGKAGKTWGPGSAKTIDDKPRDFGMQDYGPKKTKSQGESFSAFLSKRKPDQPFFYWFGSANPHRPYKLDDGVNAGKKIEDIDHVPAYWPDNESVRKDMLDYATELEAFDQEVGSLIDVLDQSGLKQNTIVIVTSDHGMPFPRVKGHTYDDAHHVPMIVNWPAGIKTPGTRVKDLLSFIDIAPTFLELMSIDGVQQGMSPLTGKSFVKLIKQETAVSRDFVILGRERNDVLCRLGTPSGLGYPARAIRTENFFYVHNFKPDRWPCGDPAIGLDDTDASPTKELIEVMGDQNPYWQHAFGKRPADQLFDLSNDPDCVKNLAEEPAFRNKTQELKTKLLTELKAQGDPRALGQGDIFDEYLSAQKKPAKAKDSNVKPQSKK